MRLGAGPSSNLATGSGGYDRTEPGVQKSFDTGLIGSSRNGDVQHVYRGLGGERISNHKCSLRCRFAPGPLSLAPLPPKNGRIAWLVDPNAIVTLLRYHDSKTGSQTFAVAGHSRFLTPQQPPCWNR